MMYHTKMDENYICSNLMADRTQIPREIRESGYKQRHCLHSTTLGDMALSQNTIIRQDYHLG